MQQNTARQALFDKLDALEADGKRSAAIRRLAESLKADPGHYAGWLRLSRLFFQQGNIQEAVHLANKAEQHDPLQADFQVIQAHMQAGRLAQAENAARQMLTKIPGHPRAAYTIAELSRMKRYPEPGISALSQALEQMPANPFLRQLLVGLLEQAGAYQRALAEAQTLVKVQESAQTLWVLATLLLNIGRNEDLLTICDRMGPHCTTDRLKLSEVELLRGQALRVLGRREASVAAYRNCLRHNPKNVDAWWALADMKTFSFLDEDRRAIKTLISTGGLTRLQKSVATFALAKAAESDRGLGEAMQLYQSANDLHPAKSFDTEAFDEDITARIAGFNAAALLTQASPLPQGPTPIFIVGLPRSGSTLVEQILASHSRIEGTIEQPTMPGVARAAHQTCRARGRGSLVDSIGGLSPLELSELGQRYIDSGAVFRGDSTALFTDKQPFNFLHTGLIHKILPHAKIIDVRRNPLDCGFSLYRQHFPKGVEFSYSLDHIGRFYNGYLRLMDHWNAVLPGRVFTVHYEHLIRTPETVIRDVLDHLDLPFQSRCLDFHRTQRAVRTASSEQVRQPINTRGIGMWQEVNASLGPLKTSLGTATLARFDGLYRL